MVFVKIVKSIENVFDSINKARPGFSRQNQELSENEAVAFMPLFIDIINNTQSNYRMPFVDAG